MPPTSIRCVPDDELPDVLRAATVETVPVSLDATIPMLPFLRAIAAAGLTIRPDGNGGILIVRVDPSHEHTR